MYSVEPKPPRFDIFAPAKVKTSYDSTKFIERGQDPRGNILVCPDILNGKPTENQTCSGKTGCKNIEDYYFNLRVKMKSGNYMGMWPSDKPIRIKKELKLAAIKEHTLDLILSENEKTSEKELTDNKDTVAYSNQTPNGWMANSNQVQNSPVSGASSEYTGLGIEEEQYAITGKRLENSDSSSSLAQLDDLPVDQSDAMLTTELRINEDMIPSREDHSILDNNELSSTSYELNNDYDNPGDLIDFRSLPDSPIQTSQSDSNVNRFQYDKTKLNPNPYETTQSEYNINQLPDPNPDTSPSEPDLDQAFDSESELESETISDSSSGSSASFNLNSFSDAFNRIAKTRSLSTLSSPHTSNQPDNDPYLNSQSQPNLSSSRPTDDTQSNTGRSPSSSNSRRLASPSGENSGDEDYEEDIDEYEEGYENSKDGEPSAELAEFLADGENDEDE